MRIFLTDAASSDLESVKLWSERNWPGTIAAKYLDRIRASISALADFPELAPRRPGHDGERQRTVGSHVVIYSVNGDLVEIMRVAHYRTLDREASDNPEKTTD